MLWSCLTCKMRYRGEKADHGRKCMCGGILEEVQSANTPKQELNAMFEETADDEQLDMAHERRITRCKTCNARIIFLLTVNGKRIPVDADTVEAIDQDYEHGRHVSHFSSCAVEWAAPDDEEDIEL